MRHLSILATATLLGLTAASAETTTVTLLCPFDPQNLVGSVIGSVSFHLLPNVAQPFSLSFLYIYFIPSSGTIATIH